VAVLALTATAAVLTGLPSGADFPLEIVASTATNNGDGTWTVTGETLEAHIAALEALGCTVRTVIDDAEQLARWQVLETQIDNEPPVA
jgi:hypothetical protein